MCNLSRQFASIPSENILSSMDEWSEVMEKSHEPSSNPMVEKKELGGKWNKKRRVRRRRKWEKGRGRGTGGRRERAPPPRGRRKIFFADNLHARAARACRLSAKKLFCRGNKFLLYLKTLFSQRFFNCWKFEKSLSNIGWMMGNEFFFILSRMKSSKVFVVKLTKCRLFDRTSCLGEQVYHSNPNILFFLRSAVCLFLSSFQLLMPQSCCFSDWNMFIFKEFILQNSVNPRGLVKFVLETFFKSRALFV